ncbi:MAG: hypothetical protein ACI9OD_004606, partial [Limisphaerales bacterium]
RVLRSASSRSFQISASAVGLSWIVLSVGDVRSESLSGLTSAAT